MNKKAQKAIGLLGQAIDLLTETSKEYGQMADRSCRHANDPTMGRTVRAEARAEEFRYDNMFIATRDAAHSVITVVDALLGLDTKG